MGSSGNYSISLNISFSLRQETKNSNKDIKKFLEKNKNNIFKKIEIENENDIIEKYIKNGNQVCLEVIDNENYDEDEDFYDDNEYTFLDSSKFSIKEMFDVLEDWDERELDYSVYILKEPEVSLFEYLNLNIIEKYKLFDIDFNTDISSINITTFSDTIYSGNITNQFSINLSKFSDLLSLPNLQLEVSTNIHSY